MADRRLGWGVVAGVLLALGGGALNSLIDDVAALSGAPTREQLLRFSARIAELLVTGTVGLFFLGIALPERPSVRSTLMTLVAVAVLVVLVTLAVAFVGIPAVGRLAAAR
jgi:hypothetical protein